jgi:hypothetical protein
VADTVVRGCDKISVARAGSGTTSRSITLGA